MAWWAASRWRKEMKYRPILMSAPMVRASLDGTKTQTRRIVKGERAARGLESGWHLKPYGFVTDQQFIKAACPYGQPGDRLWVREAWMPDPPRDGKWGYTEWAGCRIGQIAAVPDRFRKPEFCNYRASWPHKEDNLRWTPGIHMPRWASRITLEVTGVRVERLQDISEADSMAEGIERLPDPVIDGGWSGPNRFTLKGMGAGACTGLVSWNAPTATELYQRLWTEINGPGSWDANPWVWVIDFQPAPPG